MAHLFTSDQQACITHKWQQPIQRIFWIYDVPAHSFRGGHRHQADSQMILHCSVGRVSVYVQTPERDHIYCLEAANQYLWVAGADWRVMYDFSADAILTVLASHSFTDTVYWEPPYRPVVNLDSWSKKWQFWYGLT